MIEELANETSMAYVMIGALLLLPYLLIRVVRQVQRQRSSRKALNEKSLK